MASSLSAQLLQAQTICVASNDEGRVNMYLCVPGALCLQGK